MTHCQFGLDKVHKPLFRLEIVQDNHYGIRLHRVILDVDIQPMSMIEDGHRMMQEDQVLAVFCY